MHFVLLSNESHSRSQQSLAQGNLPRQPRILVTLHPLSPLTASCCHRLAPAEHYTVVSILVLHKFRLSEKLISTRITCIPSSTVLNVLAYLCLFPWTWRIPLAFPRGQHICASRQHYSPCWDHRPMRVQAWSDPWCGPGRRCRWLGEVGGQPASPL